MPGTHRAHPNFALTANFSFHFLQPTRCSARLLRHHETRSKSKLPAGRLLYESNPPSIPTESARASKRPLRQRVPRAPHSTSNPCGILAQHWTRSAFCVGSAFALCVLPAPSITDRPSSQRPSVCLPFNPAGYLLLRALSSVLPSNPSLPGFLLAGRQPCRTRTGNINRGQLPLADLSSGCISRLGHLSVRRVSHRQARLFRTCSPLPELTTHRTHASPNRLEVRRHPSPSTLLAVRPVLRHSDPRGPLREKS